MFTHGYAWTLCKCNSKYSFSLLLKACVLYFKLIIKLWAGWQEQRANTAPASDRSLDYTTFDRFGWLSDKEQCENKPDQRKKEIMLQFHPQIEPSPLNFRCDGDQNLQGPDGLLKHIS